MNLEIRQLTYFIAVAEELNFTRAAARLHIAQQALSAQIRQLEERLDTRLFERTTRKVELTEAGEVLLDHARSVLAAAQRAESAVRAVSGASELTVGMIAALYIVPFGRVLELFATRRPDIDVRVHFVDTSDWTGGIASGRSDVALAYGEFTTDGLDLFPVWEEELGIALASDHPLAQADHVSIRDYVNEPTFDFETADPIWHDYWMSTKFREGKPPRLTSSFISLDALIEAIRAKLGIHMATERLVQSYGPDSGVTFRPVPELGPLKHYLIRRAGDDRPEVVEFIEAAQEVYPPGSGKPE